MVALIRALLRSAQITTGTIGRSALTGARAAGSALAVVGCAAVLAGCATNLGSGPSQTSSLSDPKPSEKPYQPQKPVRIAMLLQLSGYGPAAVTAKGMKQAGELALFELDNPLVQIIVKDDKGTPAGAAAAAGEALAEGAEIIIGPLTAGATSIVAPIARKSNVPVLSFSNDRRVAGNGVYLMSSLPEQEIERIVSFAASKGKRRFAALIPDDEYGKVIEPILRAAVTRSGANLAILARYPAEPNAMLPPVRQLIDDIKQWDDTGAPVDTLLLAGGGETLERICPLMSFSGLNPAQIKVIGTGDWDFPNAGRNAALAGGWYPAPDPHGWQDFTQRFSRSFGTAPPRLASLAYDAVSLAITLSANEPGQRYTVQNLTRPSGFQGIDGQLRFSQNGLPDRGLAVLERQAFGSSLIEPSNTQPQPQAPVSTAEADNKPKQ
ncbi:MAG: penicillin-binding protein activator [Hyphomicrobium sp.]